MRWLWFMMMTFYVSMMLYVHPIAASEKHQPTALLLHGGFMSLNHTFKLSRVIVPLIQMFQKCNCETMRP